MRRAETTVGDRVAVNKHVQSHYKLSWCQVVEAPVGAARNRRIVLGLQLKPISLHKVDEPTGPGDVPEPLEKELSPGRDVGLILAAEGRDIRDAPASVEI